MNSTPVETSVELDDALAGLEAALDAVITAVQAPVGGHETLPGVGDDALLEGLRRLERVRNRVPVVEHAMVAEVGRRELPQRYCQSTTRRFLSTLLRLSPGEAARRVRASEAMTQRATMNGEPLPPDRPLLAEVVSTGEVSAEQTDIVLRALSEVDHRGFDPDEITAAERLLCEFTAQFAAPDLRRLARRTIEAIDPDGTRPLEDVTSDRRWATLREGRDGMWRADLRLTPTAGAKLHSVLAPLAQDRTVRRPAPDLGGPDHAGPDDPAQPSAEHDGAPVEADERSYPQRLHDALEEACDLILRGDQLPASGGTPATVIITLSEEQLARAAGRPSSEPGAGHGSGSGSGRGSRTVETADDHTLPLSDLAHLAGEADLCTITTSAVDQPLTLGRTRRIATPSQTLALVARDGGCSFPGCDHPPRWCERHHVIPWWAGGTTDLDNLTLLCSYHHRHHLDRGWTVELDARGLPIWIPPVWIDPARRPRLNHRILSRQRLGVGSPPAAVRRPRDGTRRIGDPRGAGVASAAGRVDDTELCPLRDPGWWQALQDDLDDRWTVDWEQWQELERQASSPPAARPLLAAAP